MAKTIITTVTVTIAGDGLNETHTYQATNTAGAPAVYQTGLGPGSVGISSTNYPGMLGVFIVPTSSPLGVAKTLRGNVGDTGIGLNPNMPCLVLTPAGNSVVLNLSSVENQWWKFL